MKVFDVFVNGQKLCRAGVGSDGVLDTIVSWVKLTGEAAVEARRQRAPAEELRLHVGGLSKHAHHQWVQRTLRVGDRVNLTIASAKTADVPRRSRPQNPRLRDEQERRYYERLKQKFEPAARAPGADEPAPASAAGRNRPISSQTTFLNVDLDLWSTLPLDDLVAAFGKNIIRLYVGKERRQHSAHLELGVSPIDADRTIRRFVALIARLPRGSRTLWNRARVRQFNVGVQAGSMPHAYEVRLQPSTIAAAARVRAHIVFTVYATEGSA